MSKYVNKTELVKRIADRQNWPLVDAQECLDIVLEEIALTLVGKESVMVTGFGTFEVSDSVPRMGRNPKTGEEIMIPSRSRVKFRPGVRMMQFVRGERQASEQVPVVGKDPKTKKGN